MAKSNELVGVNQRAKEYIRIKGPPYFRYRKIWQDNHGLIPNGMFIHHINGIKTDDRIENLELISRKEHGLRHRKSCKNNGDKA